MREENKKLLIVIPASMHKVFREIAFKRGTSIASLFRDAAEAWLKNQKQTIIISNEGIYRKLKQISIELDIPVNLLFEEAAKNWIKSRRTVEKTIKHEDGEDVVSVFKSEFK